jgi:hypothetical protein
MIHVYLTPIEIRFAESIGTWRQMQRDRAGHANAHGSVGGADDHVLGALGELAYAKGTQAYPSGLFLPMSEDDDVGGVQVRTRRRHSYDLYLWENDDDLATFALVTTEDGIYFRIHGAIQGKDAMIPKWWREAGNPFPRVSCYVIPQSEL